MKKHVFFTLLGVFICAFVAHAQGDDYYGNQQNDLYYKETQLLTNPTMQAPNASAFQKVNFIPVSNYTGRSNISVPIYTINSGGISVPISLTYNSGGVKVNDIPSSVGSNWSLNAGGIISKIVKGLEDFQGPRNCFDYDFDSYCSDPGYLFENLPDPLWGEGDAFPDLFIVSAPGLSTQYTHKKVNSNSDGGTATVFELTGGQNKIEEIRGNIQAGYYKVSSNAINVNANQYIDGSYYSYDTAFGTNDIYGINNIKITNLSGIEYEFGTTDVSQYTYTEEARRNAGSTYKPLAVRTERKVESYHLSRIKDLKTNKEITFEYESYRRATYDPMESAYFYTGGTSQFHMDSKIEAKSVKYPLINRLKKITHDQGSVEFIYGLTRQDITDEKALTQILIKDINGNIVKKINMGYSYTSNSSYASSNLNKRLQLNEVYISSPSNNNLNKYKLTYNSTKLPPRGAWGQDFLGYHNNSYTTAISDANAKPNIYFYPDKGIHSFLPINRGTGYYLISGNYSLNSNLTYAKAGILEKIEYPTGGFSEFEYELNQFKVDNSTISGGGLRIKTQKIIDELGNEQILDYEYKESDNSSSGKMVAFPVYTDFRVNSIYSGNLNPTSAGSYFSFKTYRAPKTQAELTHNSFVGYSRVITKNRIDNGYIVYSYSSPNDFPDDIPEYARSYYQPENNPVVSGTKEYIAFKNGMRNSTINNEVYRGKLKKTEIFDKNNTKLKEVVNQYSYKLFSDFEIRSFIRVSGASQHYNTQDYDGPNLIERSKLKSERYLLTESNTVDYFNGGNTLTTQQITYDNIYPLVTEKTINDGVKTIKSKYYYPHSPTTSSNNYMGVLRIKNRYSEMIKRELFNNNEKIYTEVINYNDFGNGIYLPEKTEIAKGTEALEIGSTITKRDGEGNILEYKTKGNVYTSFIYGFGNSVLLAKIENAQYDTVIAQLPVTIIQLQTLDSQSDESTLHGYFDTLRNNLTSTKIVSYTYIPSIGVSTITDTRGKRIKYIYDEFNRLSLVKDQDNNIIKRYQYNYKNQ